MHEYANVSASSYDPASLARKLTEKSAEGWEVVAIVPTGADTTAFLRRSVAQAEATAAAVGMSQAMAEESAAVVSAHVHEAAPAYEPAPSPSPVEEPAGWAVAPEQTAQPAAPATVLGGMGQATAQPAAQQSAPAQQASAQSSTPAGWYHDPSGRYELRYWDGSQWTEHVARGGQQFTDPPVA